MTEKSGTGLPMKGKREPYIAGYNISRDMS